MQCQYAVTHENVQLLWCVSYGGRCCCALHHVGAQSPVLTGQPDLLANRLMRCCRIKTVPLVCRTWRDAAAAPSIMWERLRLALTMLRPAQICSSEVAGEVQRPSRLPPWLAPRSRSIHALSICVLDDAAALHMTDGCAAAAGSLLGFPSKGLLPHSVQQGLSLLSSFHLSILPGCCSYFEERHVHIAPTAHVDAAGALTSFCLDAGSF